MERLMPFFWSALLISMNAYFVVCDVVLLSVRRTKIDQWVKTGNRQAKLVKYALKNLKIFLPTIQVGITITSIALGLIGSPWLEKLLESSLPVFIRNADYFNSVKTLLSLSSFLFLTYIQLVFGEMLPKTLTLGKPEIYSLFFIPPLYIFVAIFRPLTSVVNMTIYGIIRLLGIKKIFSERPYSEQEIKIIMNQSGRSGEISTVEMEMAYNVFKLKRIRVGQIMRPNDELISFDGDLTLAKVKEKIAQLRKNYNRYPVYDNIRSRIVGFFHITDLYRRVTRQAELDSLFQSGFIRKVLYLNEDETAQKVMAKMIQKKIYLGVIQNKKKKALGIVSLTDIVDNVIKKSAKN